MSATSSRPPLLRVAAPVVAVLAVLSGCSGGDSAGAAPVSSTTSVTSSARPAPVTPTTPRRTVFTPTQPSVPLRDIPLPPGAPYGGALCSLSGNTAVGQWYLGVVVHLERGESIPPEDFDYEVGSLPDYQQDLVEQAVAFDEEGVPPDHVVRADLAELQAALAEAVAVAQARDSARVLPVYDRMQYAQEVFEQSCSPLEG